MLNISAEAIEDYVRQHPYAKLSTKEILTAIDQKDMILPGMRFMSIKRKNPGEFVVTADDKEYYIEHIPRKKE